MKRSCEYCESTFELGVDHIVPVSTMFSGRRAGSMRGYGDTVICCRECNSLLGNKHYHTRHARALYLVECYANRLQGYSDSDQLYTLDKLKACIINYEAFLMAHLDKTVVDEYSGPDDNSAGEGSDEVESDSSSVVSLADMIGKKGVVDLHELVGVSLSDIDEIEGGVRISDLFVREFGGSHFLAQSLIRRLRRANSGRLAVFRDQIFKAFPDSFSVATKGKLAEDDGQMFFVALVLHGDIALEDRREIHRLASWFS